MKKKWRGIVQIRKWTGSVLPAFFMAIVLTAAWGSVVFAAENTTEQQTTVSTEKKEKVKAGWIKKTVKKVTRYYWRQSDGTILKKTGHIKLGNKWYYLRSDGSRVESEFKKVDGNYYYFKYDGHQYIPSENIFRNVKGERYYFYKKTGKVAVGQTKIGKKYYYFDSKGRLKRNLVKISVGKNLYEIDVDGVMKKTTTKRAECRAAAQAFIKKHSSSSQSNAQKFRSCFNYMNWYMRYTPGYFRMSSDYQIIAKKEGTYELALSMFNSPNFRGNCHRFAACVGAVAYELGYNPTVITITGDHSYVVIDGRYYDNSGGRFGTSSPSVSGKIFKSFKF